MVHLNEEAIRYMEKQGFTDIVLEVITFTS